MENFTPLSATLDGISEKLSESFGGEYTIYPEEVKQGMKRPCFFIKLLKPSNKKEVGQTYNRDNSYCIHFFPKNTNQPKAECYRMQDSLYIALEYIEVGGNLVRGTGMRGEIHDEILQFYVDFNVRVRQVADPITMETLQIQLNTKG